MDSLDSAHRFMGGVFLGALVAAAISLLLGYVGDYIPFIVAMPPIEKIVISAIISIIIVCTKPCIEKFIQKRDEDNPVLREDRNSVIRGRITGVPLGVIVAILIQIYIIA
ncbi:hypothetical protein [Caballeronia sp. DA-9]|uniref:hypothetical protein n=1 Tax=Caballeronia sp. DA-9 TaxID=3436237 RepID=UPI003F67AA8C